MSYEPQECTVHFSGRYIVELLSRTKGKVLYLYMLHLCASQFRRTRMSSVMYKRGPMSGESGCIAMYQSARD